MRSVNSKSALLASMFVILSASSAEADPYQPIPAAICLTVASFTEDGDKFIIAKLDDFAEQQRLDYNPAAEMGRTYVDSAETALISVHTGFGKFGVLVDVYSLDESTKTGLLDALVGFVYSEIAPTFDVRSCDEIEGFKNPKLFGW